MEMVFIYFMTNKDVKQNLNETWHVISNNLAFWHV